MHHLYRSAARLAFWDVLDAAACSVLLLTGPPKSWLGALQASEGACRGMGHQRLGVSVVGRVVSDGLVALGRVTVADNSLFAGG